jgi:hypothetical protein
MTGAALIRYALAALLWCVALPFLLILAFGG